jgi:hypothetical protein
LLSIWSRSIILHPNGFVVVAPPGGRPNTRDDTIIGTAAFDMLFGDTGGTLSDDIRAATIKSLALKHRLSIWDASVMTGNGRGGNDGLDGEQGNDLVVGDSSQMMDNAQRGKDDLFSEAAATTSCSAKPMSCGATPKAAMTAFSAVAATTCCTATQAKCWTMRKAAMTASRAAEAPICCSATAGRCLAMRKAATILLYLQACLRTTRLATSARVRTRWSSAFLA